MLTHPTIDLLRALKLDGMADAFLELEAQDRAKDLGHAEWLALLIDREAACRSTKRFRSRLKSARLRHGQASVEDVDYRAQRRLDKALFQQLATCRWIADHRSLLVTGPCGVGKSWLSCALWDAWHTLQPEQQGTWRSTLLAALVMCVSTIALFDGASVTAIDGRDERKCPHPGRSSVPSCSGPSRPSLRRPKWAGLDRPCARRRMEWAAGMKEGRGGSAPRGLNQGSWMKEVGEQQSLRHSRSHSHSRTL